MGVYHWFRCLADVRIQIMINWHARFTQQARWTADLRRFLLERFSLEQGQRVLEVGCGTGAVLQSLSTSPIKTGIFGLDIDRSFLEQAASNASQAVLAQGDAHKLPFEDSSFGFVCCHYLLLWVKNPLLALHEMRRVMYPGAWTAAFAEPDYGGRIDYPQELIELGELQERSLQHQGADTRLGRRLKALFHEAGFIEFDCGVIGARWVGPDTKLESDLEWEVLSHDLHDFTDADQLARLRHIDDTSRASSQRMLFVPTFYAAGQKPAGV